MVVMFVLGRSRGEAWDVLFVSAVAAGDRRRSPRRCPTVTQVILSLGGVDLAKRNAIVKELPVGRDARLHLGDQLGQDRHADDEPDDRRRGGRRRRPLHDLRHRLRPRGQGPPRRGDVGRRSTTRSCPTSSPATPSSSTARSSATRPRARCSCSAHKAGLDIDATRERLPRLATLPFDPTYKLMATFNAATDADGRPVVRCFVKGAAPAVMARAATALSRGRRRPVGRRAAGSGRRRTWSGWSGPGDG